MRKITARDRVRKTVVNGRIYYIVRSNGVDMMLPADKVTVEKESDEEVIMRTAAGWVIRVKPFKTVMTPPGGLAVA